MYSVRPTAYRQGITLCPYYSYGFPEPAVWYGSKEVPCLFIYGRFWGSDGRLIILSSEMKHNEFPLSGVVLILGLWAFYCCLHYLITSMVYLADTASELGGWTSSLLPTIAISWAVISGFLLLVGLLIHFYYQARSDTPTRPLINIKEAAAFFLALIIVILFSVWKANATIVAENEGLAKALGIIRFIIESISLLGIYVVFNWNSFILWIGKMAK